MIDVRSTGDVPLLAMVFGDTHPVRLENTEFFPGIKKNVMSLQENPKRLQRLYFKDHNVLS